MKMQALKAQNTEKRQKQNNLPHRLTVMVGTLNDALTVSHTERRAQGCCTQESYMLWSLDKDNFPMCA